MATLIVLKAFYGNSFCIVIHGVFQSIVILLGRECLRETVTAYIFRKMTKEKSIFLKLQRIIKTNIKMSWK